MPNGPAFAVQHTITNENMYYKFSIAGKQSIQTLICRINDY